MGYPVALARPKDNVNCEAKWQQSLGVGLQPGVSEGWERGGGV